jgi:hypothetical protein
MTTRSPATLIRIWASAERECLSYDRAVAHEQAHVAEAVSLRGLLARKMDAITQLVPDSTERKLELDDIAEELAKADRRIQSGRRAVAEAVERADAAREKARTARLALPTDGGEA